MRGKAKRLLLPMLLVAALNPSSVRGVEGVEPEVLWMDEHRTRAMFVPQALFHQLELDELPMTEQDINRLRQEIGRAKSLARQGADAKCDVPHAVGPAGSHPAAKSLEANLQDRAFAFTGTVVDLVPGWSTWQLVPLDMVYVSVDAILKNTDDELWHGRVVAFPQRPARIIAYGAVLCSAGHSGFEPAAVGDSLLLSADAYAPDPSFIQAWMVLPISLGKIRSVPHPKLIDTAAKSLEALRTEVGMNRENR